MQTFAINLDELRRCREVILKQIQHLGDICDGLATSGSPATGDSVLGASETTTKLGTAYQKFNTAAIAQLTAAKQLLAVVDQSLRAVGQRAPEADTANAHALVPDPTK